MSVVMALHLAGLRRILLQIYASPRTRQVLQHTMAAGEGPTKAIASFYLADSLQVDLTSFLTSGASY